MTDEQVRMLRELAGCTFRPASPEKRFVRDLNAIARFQEETTNCPEQELTPRQAEHLLRLHHRFRRQIPSHVCSEACRPFIGERGKWERLRLLMENAERIPAMWKQD